MSGKGPRPRHHVREEEGSRSMDARSRIEGIQARARRELQGANRQQQRELRQRALDEIREAAATAPVPLRRVADRSFFDGVPTIGTGGRL